MMKAGLTITLILVLSYAASSQVPAKDLFPIHVSKVRRVEEGCTVEAESAKVRFKLTADMSGSCAILRAGETYTAFRGTAGSDWPDHTKDTAMLFVYDSVRSGRRNLAGFQIDSEEAIARRAAK